MLAIRVSISNLFFPTLFNLEHDNSIFENLQTKQVNAYNLQYRLPVS